MFGILSRLDRMVIRETLRSVGYTLAVVLVLAVFGAALRPLGRGDFDSAGDMAEFLFLVALPMLEYSLPWPPGLVRPLRCTAWPTTEKSSPPPRAGVPRSGWSFRLL